ncbi:hypothetical protein F4777DRAFT_463396 [Nemania sp. FL0916]|nr:hypothetical protein F4777DRAFT_463396 [Nemania sp. FL0916]
MCYQVVEVYAACRCLYYKHAVDRCPRYGHPNHEILKRTIPVGYACSVHTQSASHGAYSGNQNYSDSGYYSSRSSRDSYRQRR